MKSTEMGNGFLPTLEQCEQLNFLDQIVGVSEHHASHSQSQEQGKDSKGSQDSSKRYSDFSVKPKKKTDPNGSSMKMLRECFRATADGTSSPFSLKWTNLGTMRSGNLSTVNTLPYRSTERGSTLLDILEDTVDEKYFLSEQAVRRFLSKKDTKIYLLTQ